MNAHALNSLIDHDLPLASRGDSAAYSRIVGACQNSVTSIALAMVRDVQASEDIAQEAFLSGWQNIGKLQSPSSFLPWLRQITRNLAHDHLRARGRQPRAVEDAELAIELAADPAPGAMETLLMAERAQVAAELISALPDESREVLLLYYREGQSSQQVAALLGLSDAAVRKRLSRARGAVREELLERFAAFARASAPSVGFTSLVASGLGLLAPPSIATATLVGGAAGSSLAGKFGLGASSVGGGIAGGGAVALMDRLTAPFAAGGGEALGHGSAQIGAMVAGLMCGAVFGAIGAFVLTRMLLSHTRDGQERRRVYRQMCVMLALSTLFCAGLIAMLAGTRGWLAPMAFSLTGVALMNWQILIWLPREMAPLFDRTRRETGRDPRNGALHRWLMGAPSMLWSSAVLLAFITMDLYQTGRFG